MTTGAGDFGYERVSNERAQELMKDPGVSIIDVRDEEKFEEATLPGASLIPLNDILLDPEGELPAGDILFICNVGRMSGVASQMAVALGRDNIYNLADGMTGWIEEGLPFEGTLAEAGDGADNPSN